MTRKTKINLAELKFAFKHWEGSSAFLDLDTGQVIEVAEETFSEFEALPADQEWTMTCAKPPRSRLIGERAILKSPRSSREKA